jgi:hypothetical protein
MDFSEPADHADEDREQDALQAVIVVKVHTDLTAILLHSQTRHSKETRRKGETEAETGQPSSGHWIVWHSIFRSDSKSVLRHKKKRESQECKVINFRSD